MHIYQVNDRQNFKKVILFRDIRLFQHIQIINILGTEPGTKKNIIQSQKKRIPWPFSSPTGFLYVAQPALELRDPPASTSAGVKSMDQHHPVHFHSFLMIKKKKKIPEGYRNKNIEVIVIYTRPVVYCTQHYTK